MSATLTYIKFVDNHLELDVNVETVFKVRLDGDINIRTYDNNIEYSTVSGLIITVNMDLNTLEIHNDSMTFNISYCDFPELPEMLLVCINTYMSK